MERVNFKLGRQDQMFVLSTWRWFQFTSSVLQHAHNSACMQFSQNVLSIAFLCYHLFKF